MEAGLGAMNGVAQGAAGVARRDGVRVLWAVVLGLGMGLFSVLADGVVRWRPVTMLGNIVSPWVLVAFGAGRWARSRGSGAVAGMLALGSGVASYYLVQAMRFTFGSGEPVTAYLFDAGNLIWVVAAVTVGPVMGLAGAMTRRRGGPLLVVVSPSILLLAESGFLVMDRRPWRWDLAREAYRVGDLAIMVAVAVTALVLAATVVEPAQRRRALLVVVGFGLVGAFVLVGLYRFIVSVG